MSTDYMKNRLQLADETIAILRSSNSQLDRNLSVLQSDFSVLESLLIESGQTLQRLQEMYHKEKEVSTMLSAALDKANAQNAELTEQLEQERGRNKDALTTPCKDTQPQRLLTEKKEENESNIVTRIVPSSARINGHSGNKMHEYHLNIRDSLRDMAESLCDELVRVEEDILALEPLLRLGQQEEVDKPPPSSSSKLTQAAKNKAKRSAGPDFIFGSPSSRLPLKSDEGLVDEDDNEEEGEEDEDEGEDEGGRERGYLEGDEGNDEEKEVEGGRQEGGDVEYQYGEEEEFQGEEEEEEEEEEEGGVHSSLSLVDQAYTRKIIGLEPGSGSGEHDERQGGTATDVPPVEESGREAVRERRMSF